MRKSRKRSKSKKRKKSKKKINPRTGRKTVYLGHRVKDTRKPGLDSVREAKDIAKAILRDYKRGRISKRTAVSRLNLLELIIKKDKNMKAKAKREARKYIDKKIRPKIKGEKS